jgi:hypothetical protein
MDRYRKFTVEMTALVIELNRTSGAAKGGRIPVDARIFNALVRKAAEGRAAANRAMEFGLEEALRRTQTIFGLPRNDAPPIVPDEEETIIASKDDQEPARAAL